MRATIGQRRVLLTFRHAAWDGETDQYGNPIETVTVLGPYWCRMQPLKGSETVIAARLSGIQPMLVIAPWNPDLAAMTASWELLDEAGVKYDIKSVANTDERKLYLDILAQKET